MSRSIEQVLLRGTLIAGALSCAVAMGIASAPAGAQESAEKQAKVEIKEQPQGKAFKTPEAAAAALFASARRNDEDDMIAILGPGSKEVVLWDDDAAARKERHAEFAQKYDQMHRLVREPDGTIALYVGAENWPIPFPLVEYKGSWYFDSELGNKEVMFRRIGRNEIDALQVEHALVDAEKEYFQTAHEYTAKFVSSSGAHDGLYWDGGGKNCLIGPYLAHAGMNATGSENGEPYHGYYYRIVTGEGGKSSFAIVAFPAKYRMSGVMTFVMDQDEHVVEKDLGPMTFEKVKEITASHPDSSWEKVE